MNTTYNFNTHDNCLTYDEFTEFITHVSQDFVPPILERIEIKQFYDKITSLASIITCRKNNRLVGLCIFYCNDNITFQAYLNLIAVSSHHRGKGIASKLCHLMETKSKKEGMTHLSMHTNSEMALKLYNKLGYSVIESAPIMGGLVRYKLKKQL